MATKLHCDECGKIIEPNEYRISMIERDNERRFDIKRLVIFCSTACTDLWVSKNFNRSGN